MQNENLKKMLNVGCGNKFHKAWVNIDMVSYHPDVIEYNILAGLPFPSDTFDVVYHSQVLEHIPKHQAAGFIAECFRVLKPNGIIRVVLPNLENIVEEYQKCLQQCLTDNNPLAEANYEWVLLEMYDQTVRNRPGGDMAMYLEKAELLNEAYVLDRIGYVGRSIRAEVARRGNSRNEQLEASAWARYAQKIQRNLTYRKIRQWLLNVLLTPEETLCLQTGRFRRGGEIHYWMYDRFSLSKLLTNTGFSEPLVKSSLESDIPNWATYELDVKQEHVYDPTSLFMEAKKTAYNT
ncbi:class I SAM-dependent methyltransferase [Spirosoma rigui]|uniref:class I SAM-dependent methyltransferase n=1 Tax=Spirosoma rigui TaxID=564064 RepID=UPI0012D2F74A|nr:methyltransferase domain-containing protein [Spirosoma rigui]